MCVYTYIYSIWKFERISYKVRVHFALFTKQIYTSNLEQVLSDTAVGKDMGYTASSGIEVQRQQLHVVAY